MSPTRTGPPFSAHLATVRPYSHCSCRPASSRLSKLSGVQELTFGGLVHLKRAFLTVESSSPGFVGAMVVCVWVSLAEQVCELVGSFLVLAWRYAHVKPTQARMLEESIVDWVFCAVCSFCVCVVWNVSSSDCASCFEARWSKDPWVAARATLTLSVA